MGLGNSFNLNELDMLGKWDFDNNHKWKECNVPSKLHSISTQFIHRNNLVDTNLYPSTSSSSHNYILLQEQEVALFFVKNHSMTNFSMQPLYMVKQGTTRTGKSYLISCIRNALHNSMVNTINMLLVLAPIGITTFNIHASTIHATTLKIQI